LNLEAKAAEIRRAILENALRIGKGHIASALSWVEIAVALFYGGAMDFNKDRFVLSKTHGHLTLDAIIEDFSKVPRAGPYHWANKLMWPGWPAICSGSLGQGLGIAAGIALAHKLDGSNARTFCVLSDAELHEGAIWEAAMFARHHNLTNLIAIIDDNKQSCANFTEDVLGFNRFGIFRGFGWTVENCSGHDFGELSATLRKGLSGSREWTPLCIIADTVKGKGIPFMEGNPNWHHRHPEGDQIAIARQALA
jgi:transketolase